LKPGINIFCAFTLLMFGQNLFAQDSSFVIREVVISGNVRTKNIVILREIPAHKNDNYCCPSELVQTTQNRLSGLQLFNLVNAKLIHDTLFISVTEKYYVWVNPWLSWADRNFNVWWQSRDPKRLIYGGTLHWNNIMGKNHSAYATCIAGFNQIFEVGYATPFPRGHSGWAFSGAAYFWSNHELWYKTENNKLQFLRLENQVIQKNYGIRITGKKRLNYFDRLEFTQGYAFLSVDSSIISANSYFMLRDTFQHDFYGGVEYISDHRDQRHYPTNGHLLRVGFGYNDLHSHGVRNTILSVGARYSAFTPLKFVKHLVWVKYGALRWSAGTLPYNYSRQLGYGSDYVRGYEPYVAEGQGFVLFKTGLRKAILYNRTVTLAGGQKFAAYKKLPLSIWFNVFADAGKVLSPSPIQNSGNTLDTQWQVGTGLGLDFVMWYNALIRAEYSFNRMQQGFFNIAYRNAF